MFIDPHGMRHEKAYRHDERARLHERLPELSREIANRSGNPNVHLDSFIVSATRYEDLWQHYDDGTWTRDKFADKHILFQEPGKPPDYIPADPPPLISRPFFGVASVLSSPVPLRRFCGSFAWLTIQNPMASFESEEADTRDEAGQWC